MTLRLTRWRGWGGRALMLVLALALIPLPVAASEAVPSKSAAPATQAKTGQWSLKEGAARAAARTPLTTTTTTKARRSEQDTAGRQSPAFFKTKGGAIALAVMVAGVGYALYSAKNDRITSPSKQ